MADIVETPLDVAFQHPFRRTFLIEKVLHLRDGVLRAARNPEPIGVLIARGFGDRGQSLKIKRLHGAVLHGRNA